MFTQLYFIHTPPLIIINLRRKLGNSHNFFIIYAFTEAMIAEDYFDLENLIKFNSYRIIILSNKTF